MFNNDRLESLEKVLIRYVEKESRSISEVSKALETIQLELHKTNSQIADHLSSNKIQLIETKTEILNAVLEKFVEKENYTQDLTMIKDELVGLSEEVDQKVDKGTIKLLWVVVSTTGACLAWYFSR